MKTASAARQLGDFLRKRRNGLDPQAFGLPPGLRRRAPGLRREEVASLCGISPTWYTWIEQGRTDAISEATLAALADGLRLSAAERTYLFELMARTDPLPPTAPGHDQPQLDALVQAVKSPAYVLDRYWDAIAWNKPAGQLFTDWLGKPATKTPKSASAALAPDRNLLRYVFLNPAAQTFIVDWADRAQRLVAEYRAHSAVWPVDARQQALLDELSAGSPAFAQAWRTQQVLSREGGVRRFQRPDGLPAAYQQMTLQMAQQPELKLTVLVPQGAVS